MKVFFFLGGGGGIFGTVYCRIAGASGGFAPWTPTRSLPWTHWGAYTVPPPDNQLLQANGIRSLHIVLSAGYHFHLCLTTNLAHHSKFLKKRPALHPSFLGTFVSICYKYGIKWRYEFKSEIVTFVESKPQHFESMKNRVWLLRDTIVDDELHEYKNLGVLKNYVGSFSNVEDNIQRTCKKVGLIFASNFDHCKVNLLVYTKLWKQACLLSLSFGTELWTLTPTLLLKLERCQ